MEKEYPPFEYYIMKVLDCGFVVQEAVEPEVIKIGYSMDFFFSIKDSWIQYLIRASFKDEKNNAVFLSGTAQTTFGVKNLKHFLDEHENINFPNGILETLFGISFSHLRAFMSKNAAGSKFSYLILPIINPSEVFNDLLKHNIKNFNAAVEKGDVRLLKKEDKQNIESIDLAPAITQKKTKKLVKK